MAPRGRPRHTGPRHANGRLMPPGPNEHVIASRRALLGVTDPATENVDLSKAENALDLALARGWISPARHRAARTYAQLWNAHARRVLGAIPDMKVTHSAQSSLSGGDGEGARTAGVMTPADYAMQKAIIDFEDGKITAAALTKAHRVHRSARIDWSRLPPKEVAAIYSAALDEANYRPREFTSNGQLVTTAEDAQHTRDREKLRRIWSRLHGEAARELFGFCLQESWPQWLWWRTNEPRQGLGEWLVWSARAAKWERGRKLIEQALDVVIEETQAKQKRSAEPLPEIAPPPRRAGAFAIERTNYVDPEGNLIRVVERRVRQAVP